MIISTSIRQPMYTVAQDMKNNLKKKSTIISNRRDQKPSKSFSEYLEKAKGEER